MSVAFKAFVAEMLRDAHDVHAKSRADEPLSDKKATEIVELAIHHFVRGGTAKRLIQEVINEADGAEVSCSECGCEETGHGGYLVCECPAPVRTQKDIDDE